jgi:hypothetical protein
MAWHAVAHPVVLIVHTKFVHPALLLLLRCISESAAVLHAANETNVGVL